MNRNELVASMAEKSGMSKKDAGSALDALIEAIQDALKDGEKVQLIGFGSFEVKQRDARTSRSNRRCDRTGNIRCGYCFERVVNTNPAARHSHEHDAEA